MRRTVPLALVVVLVVLGASCGSGRGSFVRGDPDRSGSRRASEARPHPADGDRHPLDEDRFGISGEMVRRRAAHEGEHSRAALAMESFSHPACAGLPAAARRSCPLLAAPWSRRDVEGGVELEAKGAELDAAAIRWHFLCHIAWGKVHGGEDGCPLHTPHVSVSTLQRRGGVMVRLAVEPARVDELRRRTQRIVR